MDWIQLQPTKPTTRNCAGKSRGPSYVVIPPGEAFCNRQGKQRNKLTRLSRLLHSISTILNTSRHISTQPLGFHLRLHKTLGTGQAPQAWALAHLVILALLSLAVSINLNGRSSSPVSAAVACPVPKLQEKDLEEFLFLCANWNCILTSVWCPCSSL